MVFGILPEEGFSNKASAYAGLIYFWSQGKAFNMGVCLSVMEQTKASFCRSPNLYQWVGTRDHASFDH